MKRKILLHFKKVFPRRKKTSHKGDFGKLLILAGSCRMTGCARLAVEAALRAGVGLLTLGFPKSLHATYTRALKEAMFLPLPETKQGTLSGKSLPQILKFINSQDVLALGPGLSRETETQKLIRALIQKGKKPFVLDADGLFAFSGRAKELKKIKVPFILTPHAGEFRRLFGFDSGRSSEARKASALRASRISGGVVVLKGDHTTVASPEGKIYVNLTGNAGLAKGGTGDVLFGTIAGFLAQGLEPFDAACLGVFLHGLSADLAIKKIPMASLLASDLIEYLSAAIKKIE